MPTHPLTFFEIQNCYQNETKFNIAYSSNNLPKIKDRGYVLNLDEHKSIGTHWIALHVHSHNGRASYDATYFDSLGSEHIPKEIKKIHRQQKYHNKYLQNRSIRFNNEWILLCWIY